MQISLRAIGEADFDRMRHITVDPDQVRFSGTIAQAFATHEDGVDFHAIFIAETAIGFFKIDRFYHQNYSFAAADALGLRAFMINRDDQGKGHATRTVRLLRPYLARQYPGHRSVILSVNMQNPIALRCYLSGGFSDTKEIYHGGLAGPQHVLQLAL